MRFRALAYLLRDEIWPIDAMPPEEAGGISVTLPGRRGWLASVEARFSAAGMGQPKIF